MRTSYRIRFLSLAVLAAVAACGSDGGSDDTIANPRPANVLDPEPAGGNTPMPLFVRPFAAEYPLLNYFDHDRPVAPDDTNGYQLTWRGARAYPDRDVGYDGHIGVDWLLPENTPVFAVIDSEVVFAGENTFNCWLENNLPLTNLTIVLELIATDGQTYRALYTHLNRVDVAVGDTVAAGQHIGLSGVTGCVGRGKLPHLHFQLFRILNTVPEQRISIDPYGWEGATPDPWSASDPNRASYWFWKAGQAPDMFLRP